ncbi:MAG: tetratricopeptide repeat protein, partial [Planctomycetota bacterium]
GSRTKTFPLHRLWKIHLLILAVCLAGPRTGSCADLKAKLEPYIITMMDLGPGWAIQEGSSGERQFEEFLQSVKDYQKKSGYLFHVQRLKDAYGEFHLLPFVFDKDYTIEWMEEHFKNNEKAFNLGYFRLGDALILISPASKKTEAKVKALLGRKIALNRLALAEEKLDKGKPDEAEEILSVLIETTKDCGVSHAWTGDLYLRRFPKPDLDRVLGLFQKAVEIHGAYPLLPHVLWTAQAGIASVHARKKALPASLEAWKKALPAAEKAGLLVKARTLAACARLAAAQGKPADGEAPLKEALEIEARFGVSRIADEVRNEEAFTSLRALDAIKTRLETLAAKSPPDVISDLAEEKVKMNKTKILLLPPAVFDGRERKADLEEALETGFLRKIKKNGVSFGEKRGVLEGEGMKAFPGDLCAFTAKAVLGDGCFDLYRTLGNRYRLPGRVENLLTLARKQGVSPSRPGVILAVSVKIGGGEGSLGEPKASIQAVLINVYTWRITAFFRATRDAPEKDRKGLMLRLGPEIVRKMESVLRSGRWK